jgi:hypothetical protein
MKKLTRLHYCKSKVLVLSLLIISMLSGCTGTGSGFLRGITQEESSNTTEHKVHPNPSDILPISEYDSIFKAVQQCHIAKVKIIMLLDRGYLTFKDKAEIDAIILDCAVDQLRNELNRGD